jgi:hypothetical protein
MPADDNDWRLQGQDAPSLIDCLDQILPGSRLYMMAQGLFDLDTIHGVFAAGSHFVRAHPPTLDGWKRLAVSLNSAVDGSGSRLDEAACTCFLENLATREHPLGSLLAGKALEFWKQWVP